MKRSRRIHSVFVIVIILFFVSRPAVFCFGEEESKDMVKIIKPLNGWSGDRVLELEAEIGDPSIGFAYLVENGTERMVRVKEGRVKEALVLSPGSNQIVVQVRDGGILYSDCVVLYSEVPKKDIKIILTWDTDGTDVDLHVTNPSKEACDYTNRETKEGGKLDVDITDGYGPEVFTQADAFPGEYIVEVYYYSSHGNPQSVAQVQVILFEGTDMEKRYRFEKVLVKTNDVFIVGTFNIDQLEKQKE
jgi:uncharacterized protein YfaP (DUF2135 family)